jgi:hypothetical protein
MNTDASQASEFISKSNIEFSQGNYPKALEYASLAANSLDATNKEQISLSSSSSTYLLLIPLAASVGFFIIVKYRSKIIPRLGSTRIKKERLNGDLSPNTFKENILTEKQSPIKEQITMDSSDQSDLHRLVFDIIKQKGNLKPEEKDILFYISEKEGAAFEGEIRNKFILPKTSLWRLIKRLEREDLIEITKIGGQNLIKLKFQK